MTATDSPTGAAVDVVPDGSTPGADPPAPGGATRSRRRPLGRGTLRRRTATALGALALLLVASMVIVLFALLDVSRRDDDVIGRWAPAYSRSLQLLSDLVDQETGVRGYALSGEPAFLQPYRSHVRAEARDEAALRHLIRSQEPVHSELATFIRHADRWRSLVVGPYIHRVRAGRGLPSVSIDQRAKATFDAVRNSAAKLADDLRAMRDHAAHQRAVALRWLWISGGIAAALVLLAFPAVWLALQRAVLKPVERLASQARDVAGGELDRNINPSGPLEVYSLGEDVDRMRARIAMELARVENARQGLIARGEELARSNADLEQFAYVASHDLSEPLRKVANFCQLLERQYAPQLDDKARQYIAFAVDGAKRMQVLIGDLLAFSRVGRTAEDFVPVDLNDVVDRALAHLEHRIAESDATIDCAPLPTVSGDPSLLTALFQNLIGNALKYRDPSRAPHVRIRSERGEADDRAGAAMWRVSVQDNGIGIDRQYAERIFVIFQRLHLRDQYGGTGIGLALCRRIVEFHGGSIWLGESDEPGARFCFTIPERRDTTVTTDV